MLEFETCDVFTDTRFGGNPLAVVHDAGGLDTAAMQAVAREFNLSETVFVLAADRDAATARIRIFTPGLEMPFAGHPNVGTAVLLARRWGMARGVVALDQPAGRVLAEVSADGAEIEAPVAFAAGETRDAAAAAACLSLPRDAVVTAAHPPRFGGCGVGKLLVELRDVAALEAAAPDVAAFRTTVPVRLATGLLCYVRTAPGQVRARMFGPLAGVVEDPATGSANLALGGLLLSLTELPSLAFEVAQGNEMGRPSRLRVAARRDAGGTIRVRVGGGVVAVSAGRIAV